MAEVQEKPVVKLVGTDGNAMALVGKARNALQRAGWKQKQLSAFITEALSGDYDHVLQTIMKYCEVE